jgi:hypothetical protein
MPMAEINLMTARAASSTIRALSHRSVCAQE